MGGLFLVILIPPMIGAAVGAKVFSQNRILGGIGGGVFTFGVLQYLARQKGAALWALMDRFQNMTQAQREAYAASHTLSRDEAEAIRTFTSRHEADMRNLQSFENVLSPEQRAERLARMRPDSAMPESIAIYRATHERLLQEGR